VSGLFAKKTTVTNTATKIGALRIQNSAQGVPVAIVFGTTRVSPNLIDYVDFEGIPQTETTETGGKGGGGGSVSNTTYTYQVAPVWALGEGPIVGVGTIWQGKAITNYSSLGADLFLGTANQAAWPYMVTNHPERARTYRFTAYEAHPAFQLGNSDSLPNMSFEVKGLGGPDDCAPDVNPATVLTEILSNSNQYGAGFTALGNMSVFRNFCNASNYMVSPAYTTQRPASEIVEELCKIGNSAPFWSEGLLKVVPYGDANASHTPYRNAGCSCINDITYSYVPDLAPVYNLTYSDLLAAPGEPPVRVKRKRPADAFNMVQVSCLDRANDYNEAVVEAKDQASIDLYKLRPAEIISAPLICDIEVARNVAQTALQRELYFRNVYRFSVGWRYARLEPMDIVTLTDAKLGMDLFPVRITAIEEDEDGRLSIEAEDVYSGVATPGLYPAQGSSGYVTNADVNPGAAVAPVIFQPPVELSGVPQIWVGSSGGANWGGAEIWASDDGSSYARIGIISAPARFGSLTANWPASSSPDTTNTLSVDLTASQGTLVSATAAQADGGDTLAFVGTATGGEIIAYSTANLVAPFTYNMSNYVLRGLRCSFASPHLTGERFMRLDAAVGRFAVTESRVGNTIYLKLLSFNRQGGGLQALADATPYTYVVQPIGIVAVNGTIPSTSSAGQVFCIPSDAQYVSSSTRRPP
jgi:Putative phage tail protein